MFCRNSESYENIANVRDLISLIYSHKIPKWGKLNEIIYFYNRVLIWLYTHWDAGGWARWWCCWELWISSPGPLHKILNQGHVVMYLHMSWYTWLWKFQLNVTNNWKYTINVDKMWPNFDKLTTVPKYVLCTYCHCRQHVVNLWCLFSMGQQWPGPGGRTIVTHWRLSEFDNMITDDDDGTSALITNTLSLCQRWHQNAIFSSIYTEGRRQVCVWIH